MQLLLAGLLVFVLSGCDPPSWYLSAHSSGKGKTRKINVSATFTGTETFQPGTIFTPGPGGVTTVQNNVAKGPFSGTLPFKINLNPPRAKKGSASAAGGGVRTVSGTYVAKSSGSFTASTGTGQFTGTMLMRFAQAKIGDACLTFSLTSGSSGATESGSFSLVGGTKAAATSRFTGTFTKTLQQTGTAGAISVSGSMSGQGKVDKPARPLNADCQALIGQL